MNNNWRILDADFPEDDPFDIWMEKYGTDLDLFVTCIGAQSEKAAEKLGVLANGFVVQMELSEKTVSSLRDLAAKAKALKAAVLYQPVPRRPQAPTNFRITFPYRCKGDGKACDYEFQDGGYCCKKRKNPPCEYRVACTEAYIYPDDVPHPAKP